MAKDEGIQTQWAACIRAASCAAWMTLLAGFVIVFFIGVMYLIIVHTPFLGAVGAVWGVPPRAVGIIMIIFTGALKFFLILWLLVCVFLSAWARRLKAVETP